VTHNANATMTRAAQFLLVTTLVVKGMYVIHHLSGLLVHEELEKEKATLVVYAHPA
jgi:hypothetical protein